MNAGAVYPEVVTKAKLKNGSGLLDYYASNYVHSSRESWRQKILAGQVKVDNQTVKNFDHVLKPNQKLAYFRPPWIEPSIPATEIPILYEDKDVMVVHKPGKVPVLPGGMFFANTVISILKDKFPEREVIAPVHRLGRGTTGALIISMTPLSGRTLSKAFREHKITKYYLALMQDEIPVDKPIGKTSSSGNMKFSDYNWVAMDGGKPSESCFKVLYRDHAKQCQVGIKTGRPHQIRIHSAYIGHPLYGDPLYIVGGGVREIQTRDVDEDEFEDNDTARPEGPLPGDTGYYLHSWKICFPHPESEEVVSVVCGLPSAFKDVLGEVGTHIVENL